MQRSHERAQFSRVKLSLASPPTKRKLISYKASFNWSRSIRLSAGTQESSIPYKVFPWERSLIVHKMRSHLATVLKAEPCSPRENYVSARGQRSFEREREREREKKRKIASVPRCTPPLPSPLYLLQFSEGYAITPPRCSSREQESFKSYCTFTLLK